jgi:hypothetical protein
MLALVSEPIPERQPAVCPACARREAYRAHAAVHFEIFEARFGTAGVTRTQLRVLFPMHADKQLVESLVLLAWHTRLPAWRLRAITKSLNPRRCPSKDVNCWIHTTHPNSHTHTTHHTEVLR